VAAVSTMILRSMRLTGEKSRGATLTANEQTECLAEFNTFVEACANERLLAYQVTQDSASLTASTASYSVGPGGTINTTRPVRIVEPCFIRDSAGLDTPVTVLSAESYGRIVQKDAGFTVPTSLFYDGGFSATSTGTIFLYPSPSASLTLFFNSWKQIGPVSTLSQNLSLPPGYQLFLETNFAVHLAAGLRPISAELAKMARDSKAAIKSVNAPETISLLDYGIARPRGNIFTGP
jgi:hypothetical protein